MILASDYRLLNLGIVPNIHLDDIPIKRIQSTKSIGVDEKLTWEYHIDYLSKRISSALGGLKMVYK